MDINDLRSLHTVFMFAGFIGIVLWAWSSKRKKDFNEAANLPLNEPDYPLENNNNKEAAQ